MTTVIIVSNAISFELRRMTQQAIDSCNETSNANIIVLEGTKTVFERCKTYNYDFPFNYNRCLNFGYQIAPSDIYVFCNNDLNFQEDWLFYLEEALQHYDSVSPMCPIAHKNKTGVYEGYGIGKEFSGWCYAMTDKAMKKLGLFPEFVNFWYSDNATADKLREKGLKHALICNSVVVHLGSQTLKKMPRIEQYKLTVKQKEIYKSK
ncbi:MAG: hypothetical protein JU82_05385 [Sulfuricurvum sp. MLSB]|jgi:hypothetical protein|uniref:glycosyltransferase family 2 protein n=1 Tax=Sulfuricurvum sp. MLSB TaxID=1537917 RepID=UPI000503C399|nr:hypothetical protein [Sulfuricurvum sp. MLSB]KFN39905.1 MAG: hypothetical protein JU82_05385 [Sulfuricurvum sp. MLSB]